MDADAQAFLGQRFVKANALQHTESLKKASPRLRERAPVAGGHATWGPHFLPTLYVAGGLCRENITLFSPFCSILQDPLSRRRPIPLLASGYKGHNLVSVRVWCTCPFHRALAEKS